MTHKSRCPRCGHQCSATSKQTLIDALREHDAWHDTQAPQGERPC